MNNIFSSCKLIIKPEYGSLEHVSALLSSLAKASGFSQKEEFRIKFALEETLTNIIFSCMEVESADEIECVFSRVSGGLEIVIHDKGAPFNPFSKRFAVSDPFKTEPSTEEISEHLIHKMVNQAVFRNLGKQGKESKLVLYSRSFHIDGLNETKKHLDVPSAKDDKFKETKEFNAKDAYEVSRLFFRSCGYGYTDETVYYPELLLKYSQDGRLKAAASFSENGSIIGFAALLEPEYSKKITELCMAVTRPDFRRQGIMKKNIDYIMPQAQRSGYLGIFAYSPAADEIAQKTSSKNGMVSCGLMLGFWNKTEGNTIQPESDERESAFVDFKYFNAPSAVSFYIPENYKEIIGEIYSALGCSLSPKKSGLLGRINNEQYIVEDVNAALNINKIVVYKMTSSSHEDIRKITKLNCLNGIDSVYLYLNLEDESSILNISKLEDIGYFFAAVIPGFVFEHTLVMQYVNNRKYDYGKIQAASPLARKIKNAVAGSDPNKVS